MSFLMSKRHRVVAGSLVSLGLAASLVATGFTSAGAAISHGKSAKPLTPVSVQLLWLPQTQFAGYYVALDKGFYAQHGLNVTIHPGGPNLTPSSLVASGAATFGDGLGPLDVEIGQSKGLKLEEVAILSQTDFQRLVSLKRLHITSPKQLDGKTVGYFTGPGLYIMQEMVAKAGGNPASVHWVIQGTSLSPITSGQWAAGSGDVFNEILTLKEEHVPINVFDPNKYGIGFPYSGIATTQAEVKQHPGIVQAFVTATLEGWQWAFKHKGQAVNIVIKNGTGLTAAHQLAQLNAMESLLCSGAAVKQGMGYINPASMTGAATFLRHYKLANVPGNVNTMYTNAFVAKTPLSLRSCSGL